MIYLNGYGRCGCCLEWATNLTLTWLGKGEPRMTSLTLASLSVQYNRTLLQHIIPLEPAYSAWACPLRLAMRPATMSLSIRKSESNKRERGRHLVSSFITQSASVGVLSSAEWVQAGYFARDKAAEAWRSQFLLFRLEVITSWSHTSTPAYAWISWRYPLCFAAMKVDARRHSYASCTCWATVTTRPQGCENRSRQTWTWFLCLHASCGFTASGQPWHRSRWLRWDREHSEGWVPSADAVSKLALGSYIQLFLILCLVLLVLSSSFFVLSSLLYLPHSLSCPPCVMFLIFLLSSLRYVSHFSLVLLALFSSFFVFSPLLYLPHSLSCPPCFIFLILCLVLLALSSSFFVLSTLL
jgi:hypothetical protein